jgi:pyruvate dehydrogenase E2 component (dihydrolipoamide acetyltransferase)
MAISVVMPALEIAQETGKLVAWRKQEGEQVAKGEILLEIETDKAVMEIESPGDGILAGVKAQGGSVVPVGQVIAWLVAPGEKPPTDSGPMATARAMSAETKALAAAANAPVTPAAPATPVAAATPAAPAAAPSPVPEPAKPAGPIRMSPKARRLAKEHGVDPHQVKGSGPTGEILAADMFKYLEAAKAAPAAASAPVSAAVPVMSVPPAASMAAAAGVESFAEIENPSAIGRIMAERTTAAWTTIPHIFFTRDIDATALNAARQRYLPLIEQTRGVRITHTDILTALIGRVLTKHPRINAYWQNGAIRCNAGVNISLAMAVRDGVVAAVIPNCHTATLGEIAVQRKVLTERARSNRLRPADLANGTFTISNAGMYDIDHFTAIVTPPQTAILAVGRIAERVVPVCGMIGIRPMLTVTISVDHRVSSGAHAALFLKDLAAALQTPDAWLEV